MTEVKDFNSPIRPTWCSGCGNFGILNGLQRALAQIDLDPHQVVIYTGIGCGSKLPDYMKINGFTSLHGRPIPIAQGGHLANHALKAIVIAGDGDTYGEGVGHLIHALRRNMDITIMVQNNRVYGLTKGQYSPTSPQGFTTKTSPGPEGAIDHPVNPIALALAAEATFVGRSWSGDLNHLIDMMVRAIQHEGAALLDIFQPCVTFNSGYSYDYYRDRVYKLEDEEGYDASDCAGAWKKALETEERIPIGVIYRGDGLPTYEEQAPALADEPLATRPFRDWSEEDYQELVAEFT